MTNRRELVNCRRGVLLLFVAASLVWLAGRSAAAIPPTGSGPAEADLVALRLAIEDLMETFGGTYPRGREFLARLAALEKEFGAEWGESGSTPGGKPGAGRLKPEQYEKFRQLQREALLANPLLNFDKLLVVKRLVKSKEGKRGSLGLPQNWQGNCALSSHGHENEIAMLSPISPEGRLTTLFKPEGAAFVGDVDLHFDADRLLFSMPGPDRRWHVWELNLESKQLRQATPELHPRAHNYDACYLPDGRIVFASTACFQGVPCVGGGNAVANLFLMNADGTGIRQLCFDQDHNWCPTVMNDGRLMYSRWEYSDTPHYFSRLLFQMNPDGTSQMALYGSNSYWPNSIFYARPIPAHPTKIVAVISGHHGVPRMGELLIFDTARGRHEASGAVRRIPGRDKKVQAITADGLVDRSWPKFLHPWPLSEKYFLVSCKPTPQAEWGIYLVDVFDNLVLLREEPDWALFEPVPLRKQPKPPVIPDRVDLTKNDATVYMTDVYLGRGLAGVPRGTVKKLRLYEPHYAYNGMGGHIHIGIDGPWDARRIIGTVPVEADGSASFKVPANVPIAVQPLDEKGQALQVMRSWFTAMPGEVLSCVGCHESLNTTPPAKATIAARRRPSEITPWYGPPRGFSFKREVQPVLAKYCVGCHNPAAAGTKVEIEQKAAAKRGWGDFTGELPDFGSTASVNRFTASYVALHPFVRRPGNESDYHMQKPLEFHASTSELIQLLRKGHHNVQLDAESWDRLITWIDLNVPDHGTWGEHRGVSVGDIGKARLEMRAKYANRPEDPEAVPQIAVAPVEYVAPPPLPKRHPPRVKAAGWPFDPQEAKRRQEAVGLPVEIKVPLTESMYLEMVLIPPGEFIIGSTDGPGDEFPPAVVQIPRPFYMARFEITNEQFALFDPSHDSGVISLGKKDLSSRGTPVNQPKQPVVRVTWQQAVAFCEWLSALTGRRFSLPTEAEWEYACRAGSDQQMYWGSCAEDFGKLANLADQRVTEICRGSPRWIPHVLSVNDGATVTAVVGKYAPNAWGLYDMHGNAAEWTLSSYRQYPYNQHDGHEAKKLTEEKVVRGGSFYDRPHRARSAFRLAYPTWQPVFNVGFRVACEATPQVAAAKLEASPKLEAGR